MPFFIGNYSVIAGRGIITSAIATGVLGFITTILFLFCIPDLNTFFALDAPQPFVQVYALAFGKGPSIFMTIIAVIGLIMVRVLLLFTPRLHIQKSSPRLTNGTLSLSPVPSSSPPSGLILHRIAEYQHSRCGLFATPLRRRARWRTSAVTLDRTRRQPPTAQERGDGHVRLCSDAAVHHHTEPSRLHVAHIGRRRADHRGLRAHCVAALDLHSALFQDFAFLSRTLGTANVPRDGAVQRAHLCGAFITFSSFFLVCLTGDWGSLRRSRSPRSSTR